MKKLLALLLAVTMVFGLVACASAPATADKTETPAPAEKEEAPAEETPAEEPEEETEEPAAKSDLETIKEAGKLVIGYTVYEPMNYTDADGNFVGFDTQYAEAICEKLGVEPEFVEINWDTKIIELDAGTIDCIWNGMTITDDIKASINTSKPYVKNAQVVIAKADAGITSTADLIGKDVVAEIGSAGEAQVQENEDLMQANYIGMTKQTDCLMEIKAGTATAAVLDWTLAKSMVGEGTDFADLVMVDGLELATEEYGIGMRAGSDLTAAIDEATAELVADGTLPALAETYGLALAPAIAG